jgi:hypothetical protein
MFIPRKQRIEQAGGINKQKPGFSKRHHLLVEFVFTANLC